MILRPSHLGSALIGLVLAAVTSCPAFAQGLRLSEFLARNGTGLQDEDGEYSDWIELHNEPGLGQVDLAGWSVTDDPADLAKWTFPVGVSLQANAHLVVFASGKDRRNPAATLHTNFRISGAGEYLALVDPSGAIVTQYAPAAPPQFEDISYGLSGASGAERYFTTPTPGSPNGAGGPPAFGAEHAPLLPGDQDPLIVTVRVPATSAGGAVVDLVHRVMYGPQQSAAMLDDGVWPDAVAGDEIHTAAIPPGSSGPGEMVRYKITVLDAFGATTLPPFQDPLGSPEWYGTVVSDPGLAGGSLAVWQWFVQNPTAALTESGTRCSLWIEERFYDNVKVKRRGASSTSFPRKSLKFDFNPDDRPTLQVLGSPIDEANLNTHYSDKAHVRQHLSFGLYDTLGAPASRTFPVRLEQNGEFYSIQTFIEEVDRFYLARAGEDPNGAMYKMFNTFVSATNGVEKVTRTSEDHSDLQAFVAAVTQGGPGLEAYLFDHLDVPRTLNYLAASWLIHENDHVHKNHFLYRDSDGDGEWHFIPWDKDLTWGRNYNASLGGVLNDEITHSHPQRSHVLMGDRNHTNPGGNWNRLIDRIFENPRLRAMYLRRLRSVCDARLQVAGTPLAERYIEGVVDDLFVSWSPVVALDRAKWGLAGWATPRTFEQAKDRMLSEYVENRRTFFYGPQQAVNGGLVPESTGGRSAVRITAVDPSPFDRSQEYIEVSNVADYAVDLSGYRLEGGATWVLPAGTVVEGGGRLYLTPDVAGFRGRASAPHGGQGHLVVGPYAGDTMGGELVILRDPDGRVRARTRL